MLNRTLSVEKEEGEECNREVFISTSPPSTFATTTIVLPTTSITITDNPKHKYIPCPLDI
jgi:hypothetical protein